MDNNEKGQSIHLHGVSKSWGSSVAVDNIDLVVEPGTFTVLLGPSGCGKSTSLRIIAGLESSSSGAVKIDDQDVTNLPPSKRNIAMVFQNYALFPHLSVAENILFGLKVRRTSKTDQAKRLKSTAELLDLTPYLSRKPAELSGGQQQRVALGRAIIAQKPICLMDEPLSNLDAKLRNTMRTEIRALQQSIGFSMVYVTHDQSEAITMADNVVLMRDGRIEQSGSPRNIYDQPSSEFAASFIGTPPMNLVPASAFSQYDSVSLDQLTIGVRPEHIVLTEQSGITAEIDKLEYLGSDVLASCRIREHCLLARLPGVSDLTIGSKVSIAWAREQTHFFSAATGIKTDLAVSELECIIN